MYFALSAAEIFSNLREKEFKLSEEGVAHCRRMEDMRAQEGRRKFSKILEEKSEREDSSTSHSCTCYMGVGKEFALGK